jgi:DNA-binding PucR family transcriptional regulator
MIWEFLVERADAADRDGLVQLRSGFTVVDLCDRLTELATSRVGVSGAFHDLGRVPEARHQARLASLASPPGSRELVRHDDQPLPVLLASSPKFSHALVNRTLGQAFSLPDADREMLLTTARAWLAHGGSTSATAHELFLHRNTVRHRLRRLEVVTGRDLAHPAQAAEVMVALEAARVLGLRSS